MRSRSARCTASPPRRGAIRWSPDCWPSRTSTLETLADRSPAFAGALATELDLIGHRGPGEVEMRCATYADDPRAADPDGGQGDGHGTSPQRRPVLPSRRGPGRSPPRRPPSFASARSGATAWCARSGCCAGCSANTAAGSPRPVNSSTPDDVFYLTVDELDAPPPDVAGLVARRRAEQLALTEVVPPEAFSGSGSPPPRRSAALTSGESLHRHGRLRGPGPRPGARRATRDDRRSAARGDPRREGHRRRIHAGVRLRRPPS